MKAEFEKCLFIGIPAGREIKPILSDIQSSLELNSGQIRWVPPKNIHITLSFIGNVSLEGIPNLTKALEDALNLKHFRISIEKSGVFSSVQHPKIFWLGIGKGRKKMIALYEHIEKTVTVFKLGRKKEIFIPHITIGRSTQSYGKIDVLPFLEYVYSPRELAINSVALYESQLQSQGAEYKVLNKFPLN